MRIFISLFLSAAIVLPSCTQVLAPIAQRRGDGSRVNQDGRGTSADSGPGTSGDENGSSEEAPPAIYVCGVEHPDTDSARLAILQDSLLMLALQPDVHRGIGLDPDTHFLFSDSLYTTTSSGEKTIIALGGKPIIEYEGREYICDLIPSSRGVWTLGNKRSGQGFCLRLDGVPVFESEIGRARSLHMDGSRPCFVYESSFESGNSLCFVEEGAVHGINCRHGTRVIDAKLLNGVLWLLELSEKGWIVSTPEELFTYYTPPSLMFRLGRLHIRPNGRCAAVISLVRQLTGRPTDFICIDEKSIEVASGEGDVYHYFDSELPYRLFYSAGYSKLMMAIGNNNIAALDSTFVSNRRAAGAWPSHFLAACYPSSGGEAFLWHNGERRGLGFDGYPTGVSLSPPKR